MSDDKNLLGNLMGDMGENLKEMLEDKVDPGAVLSEGNLKKKRNAFWTCLIAGLLLIALALGAAVYYNATKVSLLEQGIVQNADLSALSMDESSAKSFAISTLAYLQGTVENWEPVIVIGDHIMPIPQAFKDHMQAVKGWVSSATAVLLAGLGIVALLLGRALIGTKGSKKGSFSMGGYYLGAGALLALIAGIGLWGMLSFSSLWSLLHKTLIPDGIFSATEPIMQLFPVGLFQGYLQPIAITFGILAAIVLVLPLLLSPLSRLLTSLFGKGGTTSARRTGAASGHSTRRKSTASKASSAAKKTTAAKKKATGHKTSSSSR